jgi:hypothetical protein
MKEIETDIYKRLDNEDDNFYKALIAEAIIHDININDLKTKLTRSLDVATSEFKLNDSQKKRLNYFLSKDIIDYSMCNKCYKSITEKPHYKIEFVDFYNLPQNYYSKRTVKTIFKICKECFKMKINEI